MVVATPYMLCDSKCLCVLNKLRSTSRSSEASRLFQSSSTLPDWSLRLNHLDYARHASFEGHRAHTQHARVTTCVKNRMQVVNRRFCRHGGIRVEHASLCELSCILSFRRAALCKWRTCDVTAQSSSAEDCITCELAARRDENDAQHSSAPTLWLVPRPAACSLAVSLYNSSILVPRSGFRLLHEKCCSNGAT